MNGMAKTTYGRPFYKKGRGKVRYKYVNGKRVSTVKANRSYKRRSNYSRYRGRY